MITFERVTEKNRERCLKLRVSQGQEDMIETTEECLAEADAVDCWVPVIIKDGQMDIGFAMYGLYDYPPEPCRLWMDRFFIDSGFQGKGYAKPAIMSLAEKIKADYGVKEIYLSVYESNALAIGIYKSLGFSFNGELDINGEKVMVKSV